MKDKFCSQCGGKRWGKEQACIHCGAVYLDDIECIIHKADQVNPWWRFWARVFDFELYSVIYAHVFLIVFPNYLGNQHDDIFLRSCMFFLVFTMFSVFIESIFISYSGTTIGKFLFRIKIKNGNGCNLKLKESLDRTCLVYMHGIALGIKFLSLVLCWRAKVRLKKYGITSWDEKLHVSVLHREIDGLAYFGFILIWIFIFLYQCTIEVTELIGFI